MATTELILEKTSHERTAEARPTTVPAVSRPKPATPTNLSVWPPTAVDIAAYRTEAHRLRSQAIAEVFKRAMAA
ncbi:MAG TPA: hypothetical protein VGJ01_24815 [Pseudolabrys sp.]|jgi:hypothetical protein